MIQVAAPWLGRVSLSQRVGVLLLVAVVGGASGCAGAWSRGPARPTPGEAEQRQARRYFVQAKVYQAERNWLGAIVALRCAADLDPTSPTIFSELSSSFRALGDLPMALRFARRAVELDPERSDLRRAMVQLLERSEEPGQAVAEVELLVQQEPDNWRLYRHLAYLYLQTGRTERISPLFHRVLRRPDAPVEVKTDIAAVLFRVGEQRQAEEIYRRILREHPETEDAWLGLAEVLQARGQREEALTVYRQAGHVLTESPVVFYYLARALTTGEDLDRVLREEDTGFLYRLGVAFSEAGKQEQAIRIFNEIVGKEPSTAEGWLDLARYYVGQEEFDQADQVLERAVAAVPDSPQVYLFWGTAMERGDRFDRAVEIYQRGLARLPAEPRLYLYLGLVLEHREHWEEAIAAYRQGLERAAEPMPDLHVRWGIVLARQERWEEAVAQFREALAIAPESADAFLQWGLVLQRQKRWEEAVDKLGEAAEVGTADTRVLFYLGAGLEQAARELDRRDYFDRAVAAFRRLLGIDPDDAYTLNYLGYMFAEKGMNLAEAVEMLLRAVELEPGNSAFYDSLGWAYFRLGELARAEEYLTRALGALDDHDPDEQAVIFDHAGDVARALGKEDEARRHWSRALELGPENEAVRRKLIP